MLLAGIDELSEVLSDTAFVLKNYSERDIYQKDIEEELNIRRASVSVLLKKLEENKMIIREGVPCDDRLKRIRPTANCMKMKGKIDQDIQLVEDRLTEGISSEQLKVFFDVMQKMSENLCILN